MVIDNLDGQLELGAERIRRLSDRRTGVGFDQMLLVERASVPGAEFDYRIFNQDGSEVEHCGNGARCFARFVLDRGLTRSSSITVNTRPGLITLNALPDGQVKVLMGVPNFVPDAIPFLAPEQAAHYELALGDELFMVGAASIGNPHVLLQVDDVDTAEVSRIGPLLEAHERFPNRVNVGFMQRLSESEIRLRVFERGVGETRACGSGACAAVAIAHRQGVLDRNATVHLSGGDLLINWSDDHSSIEMTGPCSTVFEGHTRM